MKKCFLVLVVSFIMLTMVSLASAQNSGWGSALKNVKQVATDVALDQLSPEAKTVVQDAKAVAGGATLENILVSKAAEFLGVGNYQSALDVAGYVISTLNSGSLDAQKIMEDAKAGLMKMAQDKFMPTQPLVPSVAAEVAEVEQVNADITQAGNSLKGLFGRNK